MSKRKEQVTFSTKIDRDTHDLFMSVLEFSGISKPIFVRSIMMHMIEEYLDKDDFRKMISRYISPNKDVKDDQRN